MKGEPWIFHENGGVVMSMDGVTPVEVTIEGGGFSDAERAMLEAELLMGRDCRTLPPGDGSAITVWYKGGSRDPLPVWADPCDGGMSR